MDRQPRAGTCPAILREPMKLPGRKVEIKIRSTERHVGKYPSDTLGMVEHVKSTGRHLSINPEDNMHVPMMVVVHKPCCTFFHDGHKSDTAVRQQCYPLNPPSLGGKEGTLYG